MHTRFIIVTGGVCSSLGKGIATASIGAIMKACGLKVFVQKLDPYLNIDPGTMSPFQHGEVFVTEDGAETDLDLGHYERFIDEPMSKCSTVTTGQIYQHVLARERKGDFLGGTIQVIPHITDAIKQRMYEAAKKAKADILMVEIGGTVGDIEGEPYLEAVRQLKGELHHESIMHIHLTLLPYLKATKELKTKPTQLSVRELRRIGLQPDMIIARADYRIPKELLEKISRFCGVLEDAVIPAPTLHSIYDVPEHLEEYNVSAIIGRKFAMNLVPNMAEWEEGKKRHESANNQIAIALVGKYTHLEDAYISVIEAVKSAAVFWGMKANIIWINSEKLEADDKETWDELKKVNGIVVPGGFGLRGIEGKIAAAKYARTKKIPFLGLCLGCQLLVIEFARAALDDPELTSEEFDEENKIPKRKYVVHFLPDQHRTKSKGGTLRLGAYTCKLLPDSLAAKAYEAEEISERHRHRYEFNKNFKKKLEEKGILFSGIWPETGLAEIVELKNHPFMLGTQFHPEFTSRPHRPHPLFSAFIKAALHHPPLIPSP
ncbi:CTP synthase [Candidatus Peribacteria bacterium RIFCSPHIGHO2_02_FULL_49_16]|nr:MAG: CTP synthase [Candidatus Peribacteria bacterium RIFCSPHIGHO2_01_FULL_49_38]OGJ59487.1 MAG: CTP synthase [Candidatus Peribacteria bacterium RIFCSPHIGHO2_02_FULL_49_16]